MDHLFKKFLYTGVGLVAAAAEQLQEQLETRTQPHAEKGKETLNHLRENWQQDMASYRLRHLTDRVVERLELVSREEVNSLAERVAALDARLKAQEEA